MFTCVQCEQSPAVSAQQLPAITNHVGGCAGFNRGIAMEIDSFLRPLPFAVGLSRVAGVRLSHFRGRYRVICDATAAEKVWNRYTDVDAEVTRTLQIEQHRPCKTERVLAFSKPAGHQLPLFHRTLHVYQGRLAVLSAEYALTVGVPPSRLMEDIDWHLAGNWEASGLRREFVQDSPPLMPPTQVASVIERLDLGESSEEESESDSEL